MTAKRKSTRVLPRGRKTREEWLTTMVRVAHTDLFRKLPAGGMHHGVTKSLPKFRVSCSWPGGGSARKRIGECWSPSASATGHTEMFISPRMSDVVKVVESLIHEMVHMYVGCEHGHKAPFRRLAIAVGLEGKMTSTHADPNLVKVIKRMAKKCGTYPHADMSGLGGRTKQSTRLIKATCQNDGDEECGMVIRTTQKWIDHAERGLNCPICESDMVIG